MLHEVRVTPTSVLKNVTITVSEEAAAWARKKAAEENTSVSKLVGRMLESQMRMGDEYQRAYRRWKKIRNLPVDAANRLSRDEAHQRRR
jgi:hypothetical protein